MHHFWCLVGVLVVVRVKFLINSCDSSRGPASGANATRAGAGAVTAVNQKLHSHNNQHPTARGSNRQMRKHAEGGGLGRGVLIHFGSEPRHFRLYDRMTLRLATHLTRLAVARATRSSSSVPAARRRPYKPADRRPPRVRNRTIAWSTRTASARRLRARTALQLL